MLITAMNRLADRMDAWSPVTPERGRGSARLRVIGMALAILLDAVGGADLALAQETRPAGAQALTKVRFTLDWRYEGHMSYFMAAKARGYFEREGIDLVLDSGAGSGATLNRVVSGAYDMGTADLSSVIEFLGNNPDKSAFQSVYLLYNRSPFIIQTLKRTGIRSPKDLAGKRMASPAFDSVRKAFPIYAKAIGIDPASVSWTTVDIALRETMLARGEVDAVPGFELDRLTLMARGVNEDDIVSFAYADAGVRLYSNVIIASRKMITEQPAVVAGVLRAINRALIEAIDNPAETAKYTRQFDALVDDAVALQKLRILLRVIDTPFAQNVGLGDMDKTDLANQVNDVAAAFGLKSRPNAEDLFNPAFLPPKADRIPHKAR